MKIDRTYLRPEKAILHEKMYEGFEKKEAPVSKVYRNAEILPAIRFDEDEDRLMFGRGGLVAEDGSYVEESGIEARIGGFYEHEKGEFRDERVVYCGYFARGWGHFLLESISRLWYATEDDPDVDAYIFFTGENGPTDIITGNFCEFFRLLGILDKVRIINRPECFREVILPGLSYSFNHYYTDSYPALLDRVAEEAVKEAGNMADRPKRVYLSRRHVYDKKHFYGGERYREYGLDMLDDYFERNGFHIIYPERITLPELIVLLRNADTVATESGSCAHNLLFLPNKAENIIIERHALGNDYQANIDCLRDFLVCYVDACYALYPVDAFGGPFILAFTDCFRRFTKDRGYRTPSEKYLGEKNLKKAIRWYIWLYRHLYGDKIFMTMEILPWGPAFIEINDETAEVFDKWLNTPFRRLRHRLYEKLGYRKARL